MKHENEPESRVIYEHEMCNFCDVIYAPSEGHSCKGNSIPAKGPSPPIGTLRKESEAFGRHARERLRRPYPEFEGLPGGSALGSQQGGDHYRKLPIQPIEYIIANGLGFLQGNLIKYATRYRDKGGAEDVRKIIHYCQLILEFEYKEKTT